MKRSGIFIRVIFFTAVIAAMCVFGYIKANESWQQNYRDRITTETVDLLQNNPFDKLAVVVIVIDGLRWDEGIGAKDKYIPNIYDELRPMGTLLTNVKIKSPTATTSSHTAMVTGRISEMPNDGHIRPVFPTMHEYFRDARSDYLQSELDRIFSYPPGLFSPDEQSRQEIEKRKVEAFEFPPEKTALYLGKDLIYSLNQSSCGRYPVDDVFLKDSMRDSEVTDYFRAKIPDVRPNMVFVNLGDVDETGHEVEWHYYVDAIRAADECVWTMWNALQELKRYKDKTLFIITTDHGRHDVNHGGYPHHGDFCAGCQKSFMLLIGPGINKNFISDEPHSETDITPTVGAAMGFATPGATGSPIIEAFENPENLPKQRFTPTMKLVADDKRKVDDRDTVSILLNACLNDVSPDMWQDNLQKSLLFLAVAARIQTHKSEAESLAEKIKPLIPAMPSLTVEQDVICAYPMMVLGDALSDAGIASGPEIEKNGGKIIKGFYDAGLAAKLSEGEVESSNFPSIALISAALARYGNSNDDADMVRSTYDQILTILAKYEDHDKVYKPGLNDFIDDYFYREEGNELFPNNDIESHYKMWLMWGIERVLTETIKFHDIDQYPLLNRQYRLMAAFCNEWQDANAMIGGIGQSSDVINLVAQGLCLSSLAEFHPWEKWELDELGYTPDIYRTGLYDWPPHHFFYLLGQANALAGAWAANDRLKLYVNDDGTIRRDLEDYHNPVKPGDDDSAREVAAALAYGLSRFELADYKEFDLKPYPIYPLPEY